ncbi:MAG: YedE-related selenium metabolism membrane protein [Desulfovibrionaceae bacterium]|nr:YedE-related selenium metabolism membrane protein [Desulfovibrionaceae bacterium]
MNIRRNVFASTAGIMVTGAVIGILAIILQANGNPQNMGICVACFERDIAGSLGLHRAAIVQYLRPEIIGLVLGSMIAALSFGNFQPRAGSAPITRFCLGVVAAMGALVFLGCPWRAILRLAGGDLNAVLGLAGLFVGIGIGTVFFRRGYSLGRNVPQGRMTGFLFPVLMLALLILRLAFPQIPGQDKDGILFYSVSGPGSMHAPLWLSLGVALVIGFIAQRSRFCTMGAIRDLILFRQTHLFLGLLAMLAAAFVMNMALGSFNPGFEGQPVAHSDGLWNFLGMVTAGLAFALAGGCPGRQLFLAGEGDGDAAVFALGMIVGAAMAHNFGTASSGAGIGPYGIHATLIGFAICVVIGLMHSKRA